ncbi:hypothetical protein KNP414_00690 [Paenibacillus mucilaginosus KNP414]|uniref:Uncharacterized protein n=1 Tax=Paenibacillus mucilaginosus (strain KNP414) TaxID=1036673 RepID=F8FQV0_PAEMK|nr:hypothetical protein KNP414_00690 [Paenibacillus mucilaginosus KNP414]
MVQTFPQMIYSDAPECTRISSLFTTPSSLFLLQWLHSHPKEVLSLQRETL